jgi:hypothetical protein
MSVDPSAYPLAMRDALIRLLAAGIVTGITDGLFSSVLSAFFYGSTVTRLWQGVASAILGPEAMNGGMRTAGIGLAMHFGVAMAWSAVFLVLAMSVPSIRQLIATPSGAFGIALLYGPVIWMTMSLVVLPLIAHRPIAFNVRWWIQLFGHIPFVAYPIIAIIGRRR